MLKTIKPQTKFLFFLLLKSKKTLNICTTNIQLLQRIETLNKQKSENLKEGFPKNIKKTLLQIALCKKILTDGPENHGRTLHTDAREEIHMNLMLPPMPELHYFHILCHLGSFCY
jgi:hypothetical protein